MHDNMGKKNMGYYYSWKASFLGNPMKFAGGFTQLKEMM
jgi:hypothetical protein